MSPPRVVPFGDSAVLIELGSTPGDGNHLALAVAAAIRDLAAREPGYGSPVPGLGSVLVPVDPEAPGVEAATERLTGLALRTTAATRTTFADDEPPIELPTRYGGADGPDLDEVAAITGLRPDAVIELHATTEYRVLFLGFAPGFAYLGDLPEQIIVPRLATPRSRVPRGSVGLAGRQTAVYPAETPGGWRLIGRTDAPIWDAARRQPALLRAGSRVRFVPTGARG
jgi:KipI family sensor histidine kinase inhibitor